MLMRAHITSLDMSISANLAGARAGSSGSMPAAIFRNVASESRAYSAACAREEHPLKAS